MILVDSRVWIDFFNGSITPEAEYLDRTLGNQSIAIGDLILADVLKGFRSDKDFATAKSILVEFEQLELPGTNRSVKAAEKFRKLRKSGITVRKVNDVIIASYCIDDKIPLLLSDRDFKPFVETLDLMSALT